FCGCGYGRGVALLELTAAGGGVKVAERYYHGKPLPPWHETTVLVGAHVYVGTSRGMSCLELATGKVLWAERGEVGGAVSVACADDHLYLRSQQGRVVLSEASPQGYVRKGSLSIPEATPKPGSTAPVVAGGRLFLRDDDSLFCYDVKE